MTGLAALAVLWPLGRHARSAGPSGAGDVAIYKDQLAEIERDRERGLIGQPEAEAARIEVSRRLLAADAASQGGSPRGNASRRRRAAAVVALLLVPLVALGVYLRIGRPSAPDQPLAARLAAPANEAPVEALVALVETRLAADPGDAKGWAVLAPIYRRMGRLAEAQQAYRNVLRLEGSTPDREADLGETLAMMSGGIITAEARAAFQRAIDLDPSHVKSRYFLGRAREQEGDTAGAIARWEAILAQTPASVPVAEFLRAEIARAGGRGAKAPLEAKPHEKGPDEAAVAAAEKLSPEERAGMVRGMVEGLAARLKSEGGGLDDWLRLVRAYAVLGERDKAMAAAADARRALDGSPEGVKAVDDLVRSLGLAG
jgi:cytochrome c-type biogenesis protein CcmH